MSMDQKFKWLVGAAIVALIVSTVGDVLDGKWYMAIVPLIMIASVYMSHRAYHNSKEGWEMAEQIQALEWGLFLAQNLGPRTDRPIDLVQTAELPLPRDARSSLVLAQSIDPKATSAQVAYLRGRFAEGYRGRLSTGVDNPCTSPPPPMSGAVNKM